MATIRIPKTIEEAADRLALLGRLAQATGWERSAIVYAFTEVGLHGRGKTVSSDSFSFEQFAALGFYGLKSKNSVQAYHERWAEYGDPNIQPGDEITLPDVEWPPIESRPNPKRAAAMAAETLIDAVKQRVDVMELLASDRDFVRKINLLSVGEPSTSKPRQKREPDFDGDYKDAAVEIIRLESIRNHGWTPDDMTEWHRNLLKRALSELSDNPEAVAQLLTEIDSYLQEVAP